MRYASFGPKELCRIRPRLWREHAFPMCVFPLVRLSRGEHASALGVRVNRMIFACGLLRSQILSGSWRFFVPVASLSSRRIFLVCRGNLVLVVNDIIFTIKWLSFFLVPFFVRLWMFFRFLGPTKLKNCGRGVGEGPNFRFSEGVIPPFSAFSFLRLPFFLSVPLGGQLVVSCFSFTSPLVDELSSLVFSLFLE